MAFRITFYTDSNGYSPTLEFLATLAKKAASDKRAKTLLNLFHRKLEILRQTGTLAGMPTFKFLKGYKYPLWELRIRHRSGSHRLLFYYDNRSAEYIILNHFVKKTDKTPRAEIERAIRMLEDFMSRRGGAKG